MTREELIEGIISNLKKKRFRAAKVKSARSKEVSDFLRKSHQQRRSKQLADRPAKLVMKSKAMSKKLRKKLA
jgi:hypothetical protein